MEPEANRETIGQEINEGVAALQELHDLFNGREMPIQVAKVESAIRAQLDAVRSLLT
jgi:hypothetical protein